jgi:hypothetical protein
MSRGVLYKPAGGGSLKPGGGGGRAGGLRDQVFVLPSLRPQENGKRGSLQPLVPGVHSLPGSSFPSNIQAVGFAFKPWSLSSPRPGFVSSKCGLLEARTVGRDALLQNRPAGEGDGAWDATKQ